MLRYLTDRGHLRMQSMLTYTDYYPEAPGGKPGGRSVEPEHFDARQLGDDFDRMREPAVQELVMGRMSMTATEAHHLLARHPGWVGLTSKIMSRYWLDVGGRMKGKRDRCLSLGNALVGMLRRTMLDRADPALARDRGARARRRERARRRRSSPSSTGRKIRIRAEKGRRALGRRLREQRRHAEAVPAEPDRGGVDHRQSRQHRRRHPDGARARRRHRPHGRRLVGPDDGRARRRPRPHAGHREGPSRAASSSTSAGSASSTRRRPTTTSARRCTPITRPSRRACPAYMIFDATYRKKYPCGPFFPGSQQPDWALPKQLKETRYLKKSDTLAGLAAELGIDAAGLQASVARMNDFARNGKDLDFHRGESLFDRYYGDEKVQPNPCLAPLETAPYYGLVVYAGDLGTKGGLKTDASARVRPRRRLGDRRPLRDRQLLGVGDGPHLSRRRRHHGSCNDLRLHPRLREDRQLRLPHVVQSRNRAPEPGHRAIRRQGSGEADDRRHRRRRPRDRGARLRRRLHAGGRPRSRFYRS